MTPRARATPRVASCATRRAQAARGRGAGGPRPARRWSSTRSRHRRNARSRPSDFLAQVPLFAGLEPAAARGRRRGGRASVRLAAGEWLFQRGRPRRRDVRGPDRASGGRRRGHRPGPARGRPRRRPRRAGAARRLTPGRRRCGRRAPATCSRSAAPRSRELLHGSPALPLALTRILGRQLREVRAPAATSPPAPGDGRARPARRPCPGRRISPTGSSPRSAATCRRSCSTAARSRRPRHGTRAACTARCSTGPRRNHGLVVMHFRHLGDGVEASSASSRPTVSSLLTGRRPAADGLDVRRSCAAATSSPTTSYPARARSRAWTAALDPIESHMATRVGGAR